jgi:hypothetical protein
LPQGEDCGADNGVQRLRGVNFYTIPIDQKLFRELNKSRSVNKFFGITYVGECVRLISEYHEADPRPSQRGWENFYGNIQGFEGLTLITKELMALLPHLDIHTIKQYVFHRVIGQTWNGYANEMIIIEQLKQEFPSCDILKSSFRVDHEYCIDAEMFYNSDLLLGIQIKPLSYKKMNTPYQLQAKANHRAKNLAYQNLYAPFVYVYYDNNKIVDKEDLLNQISTIIHFNI